jgi:hypothetical protein
MKIRLVVFACGIACAGAVLAQTSNPGADRQTPGSSRTEPIYRVTVVSRTIKAVNYGHRTIPTKVDMKGTILSPEARGEATVESKRGVVEINSKFENVPPPSKFGPGYLTYVVWAITPEGRATNLGELVLDPSDKGKLKLSTDLQAFALIVTAEPYFAVTQPSDVVVMENVIRPDTTGKVEEVEAKYELLPRGQYTYDPSAAPPSSNGPKVSMEEYEALVALYQAQNAIQIARAAGAGTQAGDTLRKAEDLYQQAQNYKQQKAGSRQVVMAARQAAQAAEDARLIAVKRQPRQATQTAK